MAQLMFSSLPSPQSRRKVFLTSWVAQGLAVVCFVAMSTLVPPAIPQARHFVVTTLTPYQTTEEPQPRPRLLPVPVKPVAMTQPVIAKLVVPRIERKRPELETKAPEVQM